MRFPLLRSLLSDHLPWLAPVSLIALLLLLAILQHGCIRGEETGAAPADVPSAHEAARESVQPTREQAQRIITLGGTVTEIAFTLGAGDRVIAVDASSTWPAEVMDLPRVGYHRAMSAEGILALDPDLIVGTDELGPPAVVTHLERAGIPLVRVPSRSTVEAALERISLVGRALGHEPEAEQLVARVAAALEEVQAGGADRQRALFVYARGTAQLMVAGRDTAAATLFDLAGVPNAVDTFDGFRPLTAEAVVAAAPDVIVMTRGGVESLGGADEVFGLPGLARTPAAERDALVEIDDLLALGFGPRLPEAVALLRDAVPPAPGAR